MNRDSPAPSSGMGLVFCAARSMGIVSHTYDLHSGFDLLHTDIKERPEFIFWHPPYWDIIQYCASYSAAGTLRVWRAAQADQAMIPHREGRTRGSRMLCADELWRLGGHDPYSLIMIRRFGRDPSGSYSVAGCGKCQKLGE